MSSSSTTSTLPEKGWRQPAVLLMLMAAAMQISFGAWSALQFNFAKEMLDFSGREIGIQQSIREIPGFLSFAAVFLLFIMREQILAYVSLVLLGIGIAVTGAYPSALGFYLTTFIGSVGFHYYETMHQSLTLQWIPKEKTAAVMGRILSVVGMAQLAAYGFVFLIGSFFNLSYLTMFAIAGFATLLMVIFMAIAYPTYPPKEVQTRKLILRKRYWLYYWLTFLGGARRQIFTVFASWMMIERFGYEFKDIAALYLVNAVVVMFLAPIVGRFITKVGERTALRLEYAGLALIFCAYAIVQTPEIAIALYILDHAFFSFDIALKTYFQKIAMPSDIAATTGVAFSINHIAAVVIPVLFGLLWLYSPAAVFLAGAAMASVSLAFAFLIPSSPREGFETLWKRSNQL